MTLISKGVLLLISLSLLVTAGCAAVPPSASPPTTSGGATSRPPGSSLAVSDRPRNLNPTVGPEDVAALAHGNSAFAFDLYHVLAADGDNLFFSPYSLSAALAMTYAGAGGDTASQMAATLHFTLPQDRLHPAFNAYSLDLQARAEAPTEGTPFELSIANSLWGQQGFAFLPEFLDLLGENYGAGMRLVDYAADPEAARQAINQWVSDETREKIRDLIPSGAIDALTRLVLADAIFFKAAWLHPFDPQTTTPEPFHLLDGSTLDVPMMLQDEGYNYALREGYRALVLPYENGDVSMLIILPDEGQFQAIEEALGPGMIEDIMDSLVYGPVILSLPRFTDESAFSLKDALYGLGMTDAFEPERADFSGMDGNRDLYIGRVLHKAFISVDERGTEAAAATAVIMELTSALPGEPITFAVDRPFIYLIRDDLTGSILFMGRVLTPEG
ncbi:MAG: serpin family protein [Chloroflexota bacterium]